MANLNAGVAVRFDNDGVILIGADTLLNIVSGTLEFTIPGYEPVLYKDRGVIKDPIVGDERPVTGKLSLRYTSLIDSDGVLAAIMGALATNKIKNVTAAGLLFTFAMTVKQADFKGATVGDQYVFAKCFVDGLTVKTQAGAETDMIEFSWTDAEASPAITRYA